MATYSNRSRFEVSVPRQPSRKRHFLYSDEEGAKKYFAELKAQGFEPSLVQREDAILVRIRQRGHPEIQFTSRSYDDAERDARRIEDERSRGLFIDYMKSMKTCFAQLVREFLIKESPHHKGFEVEFYKLNAMLVDARQDPVSIRDIPETEYTVATKARRQTGNRVHKRCMRAEWMLKPFGLLQPTDIEDYRDGRLQYVMPATVDHDLDLIAMVCNIAIKTWRYEVARSPMDGVRRPKYNNERDRRLVGDEEERLMVAAREEDRNRAVDARLEELIGPVRSAALFASSKSTGKRAIAKAKLERQEEAERTAVVIPLFECIVSFLIKTAARRSEMLDLTWDNVHFPERYAFLPETKNGLPRKIPLRSSLMDQLEELPRITERVFDISESQLRDAWERMCERANVTDLNIHDLRHEGISRVAQKAGESFGGAAGGSFSLLDLQAFSGHRDIRMLMRYAHLCVTQLAERLDQALEEGTARNHKGRRLIGKSAPITVREVVNASAHPERTQEESASPPAVGENNGNVVTVDFRRARQRSCT